MEYRAEKKTNAILHYPFTVLGDEPSSGPQNKNKRKKYQILVVDDHPGLLGVIAWALEDAGYSATKASSGEQAIKILSQRNFDLVLTDLHMPNVDGISLLKKAKELQPEIKVIIMTDNGNVFHAIHALRSHADDYLLKPFDMARICDRVARCIEKLERKKICAPASSACHSVDHQALTFMQTISHDIRGQLVSMTAIIKMLIRGHHGKMDLEVALKLDGLLKKAANLANMTEEYLGMGHLLIDGKGIEIHEVDLTKEVIHPVLGELSTEIRGYSVKVEDRVSAAPPGKIIVKGNRVLLKAVYRNLLRNAIKYGGDGCTVAYGAQNNYSHLQLYVYNSGIPVPPDHRPELFHKFAHSRQGKKEKDAGLGVGLYLVKKIIEGHGGSIRYKPKENGSYFIFSLPCH